MDAENKSVNPSTGLTNETTEPYEEHTEKRMDVFAVYHLVPPSTQAALAAGC